MDKKPNCMNCQHFFITYDPRTPRGCKLYKLQSRELPSQIVKMAGTECMGFKEKVKRNEKPKQKDLNDSSLW